MFCMVLGQQSDTLVILCIHRAEDCKGPTAAFQSPQTMSAVTQLINNVKELFLICEEPQHYH